MAATCPRGARPTSLNRAGPVRWPAAANAESKLSTVCSAVANAGTWTDWNAAGSTAEAGDGPADPAIPGNATRARAAVSAAPATILEGRTIPRRYTTEMALEGRVAQRTPAGSYGVARLDLSDRWTPRSADDDDVVGKGL